jgi:hypothetical protein
MRQVTLGYGREYGGAPRVINTDYQHVWSFTPVYDAVASRPEVGEGGAEGDGAGGASAAPAARQPRRVKCSLSTVGYVQPGDAMKFTASPGGPSGGAPVPQIGFGAATASLEPAVLYSHSIALERREPGVNSN